MPEQDQVMTIHEVAEHLKVGTKTIHSLVQRRHLPELKVGGQWRFRRKDIEKWVEDQVNRRAQRKAR